MSPHQHFTLRNLIGIGSLVATCALIFFEYFLTIQDEVELVWKAPNSAMKFGFLVYRYAALTCITLLAYCGYALSKLNALVGYDNILCSYFWK